MPYDPTLSDPISRLRYAVGDRAALELEPDATYLGALALVLARKQGATGAAASDRLALAEGHGYKSGQPVMLAELEGLAPLAEHSIYYVVGAAAGALSLAATRGGPAITLAEDGVATLGQLDELAAAQIVAGGLAVTYSQEPDRISDSGQSLSWAKRVDQWNAIAAGDLPAGAAAVLGARRAQGFTLLKGPQRDYTTGAGDESD